MRIEIQGRSMKTSIVKRSIVIAGHKTSVSLEDAFWSSLIQIAGERDETLSNLIAKIDADRQHANLSSAIRLFVLDHVRDQALAQAPKQRQQSAVAGSKAECRAGFFLSLGRSCVPPVTVRGASARRWPAH